MSCIRWRARSCRSPTTASPTPATPPPYCSGASTGSTASAACPTRPTPITANMASSSIEPAWETMMQITRTIAGRRCTPARLGAAVVFGCALFVCGCTTDQQVAGVPDVPADYRMRHPITLKESDRTLEVFIGSNRGELNPTQRAQILAFGLKWKREATGGIVIARPVRSSNEQASADATREIISILSASGMPPGGIAVRTYVAEGPALATVRISYPKITAQAGPCGIWPEDIGPSMTRDYFENQPMWNNGCAAQRNLAAKSTIRPIWYSRVPRRLPTRCGAPRCSRNTAWASIPRRYLPAVRPPRSAMLANKLISS